MKQDDVIEMARQAGFETMLRKGKILGFDRDGDYTEELEDFAKLVAEKAKAEERECIIQMMPGGSSVDPQWVCDQIRARGEK